MNTILQAQGHHNFYQILGTTLFKNEYSAQVISQCNRFKFTPGELEAFRTDSSQIGNSQQQLMKGII